MRIGIPYSKCVKRIQEDAGRDRKVNKYHFYVAEGLPEDKGKDIVRMDPRI